MRLLALSFLMALGGLCGADDFTPKDPAKLLRAYLETRKVLCSNLGLEPLPQEKNSAFRTIEFRFKTKEFAKTVTTKPKRSFPTREIEIVGPTDGGYIIKVRFRAYDYPEQLLKPPPGCETWIEEPYGYTSYSIHRPKHDGYEAALFYSFESNPLHSKIMDGAHKRRYDMVVKALEDVLSQN